MPGLELGLGLRDRRGRLPPVFDFAGGVLPGGVSVARASAGTCWSAAGVLTSVAANLPRFDHVAGGGALRGLLIEPAATNLLAQSGGIELFGEKASCTASGGAASAPDGTGSWGRVTPTTGTGVFPYIADTGFTKTAATTYTLSLFVKRETLRWAMLSGDLYGGERYAWFDLLDGVAATRGGNCSAAAIGPAGADAWRIAVTFTGTASPYCLLAPVKADASFGADYAAGDTMLGWGAMLETGAVATSLMPTAGAAASRAADAVTLDWASRGIADGAITVRYTFDNGSTQDVATTVAAGGGVVPTNLDRRWLVRAEKL